MIGEKGMLKVIGSNLCEDTVNALETLKSKGVEFEYVNILDSLENLKEYLSLRDTKPCYESVKECNGIGIPCFVKEDVVTLSIDEIL